MLTLIPKNPIKMPSNVADRQIGQEGRRPESIFESRAPERSNNIIAFDYAKNPKTPISLVPRHHRPGG